MNSRIEQTSPTSVLKPCPLWRRLMSISYDFILLVCLIFIAWQPVPLLPDQLHPVVDRALRLGYLLIISYAFFGWFWCHGGQTLGMRSWKIKLVPIPPGPHSIITWKIAYLRFIASIFSWLFFGIGFLWSIFDKNKQTWHDTFSKTQIVLVNPSD